MKPDTKIWACKIGYAPEAEVPQGGDSPMRDAVERAFKRVVGTDAEFTFSGWGAELTEGELACVENRDPDRLKATREIPYDVTLEMVEAGQRASASYRALNLRSAETVTRDEVGAILAAALALPRTDQPKEAE